MKIHTVYSMPVTNRQIRQHLLRDERNLDVTIHKDGRVSVLTNRRRGDGGRGNWRMFAGYAREIRIDVAESLLNQ